MASEKQRGTRESIDLGRRRRGNFFGSNIVGLYFRPLSRAGGQREVTGSTTKGTGEYIYRHLKDEEKGKRQHSKR